MSSGNSQQFAIRRRSTRTLLTAAAVLAGGLLGGCMRDTITGGVSGSKAGVSGSSVSGSFAPPAPAGASGAGAGGAGAGGAGAAGSALPPAGSGAGAGAGGVGVGGAGAGGAGLAAGSGGAQAGAGGAGASALVQPIERGGKYVFEFGEISFEIDPQVGGRILKCQIEGQNLLIGPEIDVLNYGSTFWPSPQARWNWPPVPEVDSQPYTAMLSGDTLALTSKVGERAKVEVTKRFTARPSERGLEIEYVLTNRDTAAASWAPWEITRVAANGLTFFPTGMKTVNTQLPVVNMGELTWYQHDPSSVGSGQKFSADGKDGWLAHVAGDKLLMKVFADVAPAMQAPAPEAEIALYAAAGYVELEPQGAYTQLMPGESVRWSVRWYLRKLPQGAMGIGNAALVEFAKGVVAEVK